MRGIWVVAAALVALPAAASAENQVAEMLRFRLNSGSTTVPPGQMHTLQFSLSRGDVLEVSVELGNSVSGIGALVCPAPEFTKYRNGQPAQNCGGFPKQEYGGAFTYEIFYSGPYVFAIDNTFASLFEKATDYEIWITTRTDETKSAGLKKVLDETYNALKQGFEFPDFDMSIAPCGEVNAYSEKAGGNITLCSELLFETNRLVDEGVVAGILFHELGHTLLNVWGLPNYQNEQTADEFAAVMMVLTGQTEAAEKYISFFAQRDTQAEAIAAEYGNSPHPLSVQRMRNVGHILDAPKGYVDRWLPVFYQHMTSQALEGEIASPTKFSNPDLARKALAEKRNGMTKSRSN